MASSFIPYSIPNHNRLANTRIYLKVSWPPKKAELSLDAELLITKKDKEPFSNNNAEGKLPSIRLLNAPRVKA